MTNGGLPGTGDQKGDTASVFEALCQRGQPHMPEHCPDASQQRLQLVLLTRESLGMSWRRRATCPIDDHSLRTITPEQSAALRDPAIFVVPHGRDRTLQAAVGELFLGGTSLDFSNPGPGFCPACGVVGDNPSDHCGISCLSRPTTAPTAYFFRRLRLPMTQQSVFPR